jgi:hypothetical protein
MNNKPRQHVLDTLAREKSPMTVSDLVVGYSAGPKPTKAEYEAVRRAAQILWWQGVIAKTMPPKVRKGRGGLYELKP